MEDIKIMTFSDAFMALGREHPLVRDYVCMEEGGFTIEMVSYVRLLIITTALNNGWKPTYAPSEKAWVPRFSLWTEFETSRMSGDYKKRWTTIDVRNNGIEYFSAIQFNGSEEVSKVRKCNPMYSICYKTEELSNHSGRVFTHLWADFLMKGTRK